MYEIKWYISNLKITCETWQKETHDLFDFDTRDVQISEGKTNSTIFVVRTGKDKLTHQHR